MLTIVAVVAAAGLADAGTPTSRPFDAAARAAAVAPFIDEQTFGVAHADIGRVKLDAVEPLLMKISQGTQTATADADAAKEEIAKGLRRAGRWIDDFTKAGGTDLYMVASFADLPERDKPFIIVPLAPGADARAIAGLLCSGEAAGPTSLPADAPLSPYPNMVCERIGQAVFAGSRDTTERLRSMKPSPRPELVKAFEAAGDTAAQVVLIPTADSRRIVEEMIPTLPEQIGGGPVTAVTRGFMWAALGMDTHPGLSMRLLIQSQDAETAKTLDAVIGRIFEQAGKDIGKNAELPNLDRVLAMLRPALSGDRLTLSLEKGRIETLVGDLLAPSLSKARANAQRTASMSNMKQIMMGCIMHTADFRGQWPNDLQTIVDRKYVPPVVLTNPMQPGRKDAYVYVKPRAKVDRVDPQSLVIYEAFDTWGEGVCVGFADGHIEFVKDKKRFDDLLAKAKGTPSKPAD